MGINWLITGGCGFIGTSLIQLLLSDDGGNRIRVVDNLSVGTRQDLSQVCHFVEKSVQEVDAGIDDVELIVADIQDDNAGMLCAQGIDVIVHLAANT